ncbi:MAG TPA: CDP-alcohol phosphatidyltransferase family protein [Stellaceae bacterium]|jgi:cardiolipin synthase|nr:CDP-alcohol phosphatidyltransferase family protein [Stellaceae bacterium]
MTRLGLNIPNLITLTRLMSVPVMIWLIVSERFGTAFCVFAGAGVSDALDGFIAKRFDSRTKLGALLDPAADKALLSSVYVALGLAKMLPNWLVILVVFRDVTIIGGFILLQTLAAPRNFDPLYISKINTLVQIALVGYVLGRLGVGLPDGLLTNILVWLTALTTMLSGMSYLVRWARILAGSEQVS